MSGKHDKRSLPKLSEIEFEKRRRILQLGVAGMPMLFSARASARQAVASALDCLFQVPVGTLLLVSHRGEAWIAQTSLSSPPPITQNLVNSIQNSAIASFGRGTIPRSVGTDIRPDARGRDPVDERFTVHVFNGNTIRPGDFVNGAGTRFRGALLNSSLDGVFVRLLRDDVEATGGTQGLPGISCIQSIINAF